jgi:uncharacterized protein YhbP (UPF0306 family)
VRRDGHRGDGEALRAAASALLRACHVATVATAGPWAAAVFYAPDGPDLVFLSSPRSRHARALARDPRAAVTIQGQPAWRAVRGVQASGRVERLRGAELERLRGVYLARFPFLRARPLAPPLARALRRARWFRFRPRRLWLVGASTGLGRRSVPLWRGRRPPRHR